LAGLVVEAGVPREFKLKVLLY